MKTLAALATAVLVSTSSVCHAHDVYNHSYEMQTGTLHTPLLLPPLSGEIGGWQLRRSAVGGITGLTVPHMGFYDCPVATHGRNIARATFVVGVVAQATFSQELDVRLEPYTKYVLRVDIGDAGIASILANAGVRVYAGNTLVATSDDPSCLTLLDLGNGFDTYSIRFCAGPTPPPQNVRIELHASSVISALSAVAFDNVRFEQSTADCLCNFNGDCDLNSQDFFDFLNAFFAADNRANFNGDDVLNSQDFFDFMNCFFAPPGGCI